MKSFLTAISLALLAGLTVHCNKPPTPVKVKAAVVASNDDKEPKPGSIAPSTDPIPGDGSAKPEPTSLPSEDKETKVPVGGDTTVDPTPGPVVSGTPHLLVGGIDPASYYIRVGQISGWAGDKSNTAATLDVKFYLDGDNKTGKAVTTAKANLVGEDGGVDGDHAFIADIPVSLRDGKPHKVYAYVSQEGVEVPLNASFPYTLSFFEAKHGDAEAIYNKIGFNLPCKGCHTFEYEDRWRVLSRDGSPSKWSKDDNALINKLNENHSNKSAPQDICHLINCPEVKNWWTAEFGQ